MKYRTDWTIVSNPDEVVMRGTELRCPICGFEYTHIRRVFTRMGSDPHEAVVYPHTLADGSVGERRSALVVEIEGECSHRWELIIQQHKGNNHLGVLRLPDAAEIL